MTDLETLKAMFDRAGIPYTTGLVDERYHAPATYTSLTVYANTADGAPNNGYFLFYTDYLFSEAGALVGTGVWE
jgi:hypothetical protein